MNNLELISELFEQQQAKGWKPAAVYFKLQQKHQDEEIKLTRDDLLEVARRLGYKEKWVDKKLEELGEPINPNAPKRNIFDGLLFVRSVKSYTTKKGDQMAFLELRSASGYEFEGIIFPNAYSTYHEEISSEELSWFTGIWDSRDQKYMLIAQKVTKLDQSVCQKMFDVIPHFTEEKSL